MTRVAVQVVPSGNVYVTFTDALLLPLLVALTVVDDVLLFPGTVTDPLPVPAPFLSSCCHVSVCAAALNTDAVPPESLKTAFAVTDWLFKPLTLQVYVVPIDPLHEGDAATPFTFTLENTKPAVALL